jgi:ABC-type enterobactin transport system permease subunit
VLIGFVTTVFLFLIANRLSGDTFRIGVVAIGTVAMITAIIGFLIAVSSAVEGH